MNRALIAVLMCFWIFLAYRAYSRGDTGLAGVYLVVGCAITALRLRRAG